MSPPGRPKGEFRSAQHEGAPVSPPGRPKGEFRSAQHEGISVSFLDLPADQNEPQLHFAKANGITLAYWESHPGLRGQGPTLWLAHATGFHGRVWDRMIGALAQPCHGIAIEQRGHGRSEATEFDSWDVFGHDQAELAARLDLQDAVGVIRYCAKCPPRVRANFRISSSYKLQALPNSSAVHD